MAYTTNQLITESYYLSSVVAKGYETVGGDQLNEGLHLLNEFLSFQSANQRMIPFYREYEFTGVIGEEKYEIPNLILPQSLTFFIPPADGTVRFPLKWVNRTQYFGEARAEQVNSLPFIWHSERSKGGTDIWVYFTPDKEYPFQLFGKFALLSAALGEDLSAIYELNYINYLRYGLAQYICGAYNLTFPPQNQRILSQIEAALFDLSPIDLTVQKSTGFNKKPNTIDWGQANIGGPWVA